MSRSNFGADQSSLIRDKEQEREVARRNKTADCLLDARWRPEEAGIRREDIEKKKQNDFDASQLEQALLESQRQAEADARAREEAAFAEALAMSAMDRPKTPEFDDDEIQKAIRASAEEASSKKQATYDEDDLLEAACRASLVDLGPRGISQPAKIMAAGDPSLGQQGLARSNSGAKLPNPKAERLSTTGKSIAQTSQGGSGSSSSSCHGMSTASGASSSGAASASSGSSSGGAASSSTSSGSGATSSVSTFAKASANNFTGSTAHGGGAAWLSKGKTSPPPLPSYPMPAAKAKSDKVDRAETPTRTTRRSGSLSGVGRALTSAANSGSGKK